jgi:5-methyltetrahydrofolate--homocysteine methyltransferase
MPADNRDDASSLDQLFDSIIDGDINETRELAASALKAGIDAHTIIADCLVPAMEEVGDLFESGEYFVSEMLVSARAASEILKLVEPHLVKAGYKPKGVVVLGTVKGDMHDIGKNIVSMMLKGGGFQVFDLGTDVAPAKFVAAIHEHEPDIIGMSALLTTTMNSMPATIEALVESGLRDRVQVMVGGAPVTQPFADAIGADGYGATAAAAVRLANALLEKKNG